MNNRTKPTTKAEWDKMQRDGEQLRDAIQNGSVSGPEAKRRLDEWTRRVEDLTQRFPV